MQSDVVSGDACENNAVNAVLNGRTDNPVSETLVQVSGSGLPRVGADEGMEVDRVKEGDLNVSLEGEMGSVTNVEEILNDACLGKKHTNLGTYLVAVEGETNQDSENDIRCGEEREAEQIVDATTLGVNDRSFQLETKAVTTISDKQDSRVHEHEGVSAGDLDKSVRNDDKNIKQNGGFCASDLVWGKVKSHPWWPAQIFEPGDASDKAKKHFSSKGYLVAYFGDHTFAWNAKAKLKPFAPNFSHMVKQTQMEAFRHAVACILDETSRRVEFGLSCRCIAQDVYNRLNTQVVENAGIREQSRTREGGDRFFTASSFEPVKFVDYVKDLAQGPLADVDRLEHTIARAQMAAFYRWKGIYHLADFGWLIGYVNNEADAPVIAEKEKCEVIADGTPPPETVEEADPRPLKRKKKSSDDDGHSSKKIKCLSDFLVKKGVRKKQDTETKGKSGSKSISSSVGTIKEARSYPTDSITKQGSPSGTSMVVKDTKPTFRVGESILRVAGQLSQPSPLLKLDVSSHANTDEGNSKQCGKHHSESASFDIIVSELHLVAIEPLKEHSLLSNMVTFISEFRNSIVPDSELLQKHEEESGTEDAVGKSMEGASGSGPAELTEEGCSSGRKSKAKASESEITTTSSFDTVEDVCYTNKTIRILEQQTSLNDVKIPVPEPEPSEADGNSAVSQDMDSTVSSPQQHDGSKYGASEHLDEKMQLEDSPTALTLKFTDMDSIPTQGQLEKIFSHFGPLKESETEVLAKKNCARVVFKRRSDAETAFSSSGKFEIFGPSLVCYQLNYAPSPRKSLSVEAKRRKKDETNVEGNVGGCLMLK